MELRIDQQQLPLDNNFTTEGNGAGVPAYILDTGIDYQHAEFGGPDNTRATFGFDSVVDGKEGMDCNGHGTHVAGTVAGATYGVARKASLVSVRVLGCDGKGTYAGMIAGMDWVAKNAKQPGRPERFARRRQVRDPQRKRRTRRTGTGPS
ncbi:S8 family serine peptidase [Streptomyces sp. NPDC054840]